MRKYVLTAVLLFFGGIAMAQERPSGPPGALRTGDALGGSPVLTSSGLPQDCLVGAEPAVAAVGATQSSGSRFWLRGEYLLWWVQGSQLPPLVTTGMPGTTPFPGVLGQAGTSILYGNGSVDDRPRSGGRFTAGGWLDPCRTVGIDASYFFLASRDSRFDRSSDSRLGSQLLARPFFDVLTLSQNAQLVAFPALAVGTNILTATGQGLASVDIRVATYSRLQGADLNAFCGLCSGCNYWVQTLVGFRYLQLNEGVGVTENTSINAALPRGAPFFGGNTISINDQFDTRNNFYGGQVGLRGEIRSGRVFLEAQTKLALGVTNQVVDIQGSTSITPPGGPPVVTPIGFLASRDSIGRATRNRFTVVPEVGVNLGYQVTNNVSTFVGYNFLYSSSVVRPADQLNLNLNGTQIPTDTRFNPAATSNVRPQIRDTGFWTQGISFGAQLRY